MARGLFRKTSFNKMVGAYRSQWKRFWMRLFTFGMYGRKGIIIMTNEGYSNADDEETRSFTMLDPFRHEDYPDDVLILIQNHEHRKQEQIWARLKQYVGVSKENISVFIATLIDEPFADIYDMHHNDEILVGYIDKTDQPYLLGLPYKK